LLLFALFTILHSYKKAPRAGALINILMKTYSKSSALAKRVVLNGNTMEQYAPIGDIYTAKKPATESRNSIQYSPLFFLVVVSML
jgi:hypothetical protein